jgi:DNA-binding transcriptional MerR regulator
MTEAAQFADGKDPEALRTIGEVAKALGIRQHVLRYWEEQFPMLRPLKRSGGRRYYRPDDVRLVERIDRLVHREGYTLKGAKMALAAATSPGIGSTAPRVNAADHTAQAPHASGPATFALRARLIALRTTLVNALHDG